MAVLCCEIMYLLFCIHACTHLVANLDPSASFQHNHSQTVYTTAHSCARRELLRHATINKNHDSCESEVPIHPLWSFLAWFAFPPSNHPGGGGGVVLLHLCTACERIIPSLLAQDTDWQQNTPAFRGGQSWTISQQDSRHSSFYWVDRPSQVTETKRMSSFECRPFLLLSILLFTYKDNFNYP